MISLRSMLPLAVLSIAVLGCQPEEPKVVPTEPQQSEETTPNQTQPDGTTQTPAETETPAETQ